MKVTQVSIAPTQKSNEAGRPALIPELLAATGARYSRNNEGLEDILKKIDFQNPDKSVDSIFRMVDYGHQSILDMVPIALFMDDISIFLAYLVWSVCPTASGQESSTRYLKLSVDGVVPPETLGIDPAKQRQWAKAIESNFESYAIAQNFWEEIAVNRPSVLRIPKGLINDDSSKSQKTVARLKRNYKFDRSRYFLPLAASTNMMLIMSARGWVQLTQFLVSHILPEANHLAKLIQSELSLVAPRMLKHADFSESVSNGVKQEFGNLTQKCRQYQEFPDGSGEDGAFLDVYAQGDLKALITEDLQFHDNRYSWIGPNLKRMFVRFGWQGVSFAEIRDLNRHRTGTKYCELIPRNFYAALDQVPEDWNASDLKQIASLGQTSLKIARQLLAEGDPTYVYWCPLGAEFYFEHTTSADKFLYEAELRTGLGAHYRYAFHFHQVLEKWYEKFPETRDLILEGQAEPE